MLVMNSSYMADPRRDPTLDAEALAASWFACRVLLRHVSGREAVSASTTARPPTRRTRAAKRGWMMPRRASDARSGTPAPRQLDALQATRSRRVTTPAAHGTGVPRRRDCPRCWAWPWCRRIATARDGCTSPCTRPGAPPGARPRRGAQDRHGPPGSLSRGADHGVPVSAVRGRLHRARERCVTSWSGPTRPPSAAGAPATDLHDESALKKIAIEIN